MQNLSQRDPRWANILLGTSKTTTIGSHGCTITCLAMLAGVSPDYVNDRLNEVGGFANTNLVNWTKIQAALPNLQFVWRGTPYDNDRVKNALPALVEVDFDGTGRDDDRHWVVYKGSQRLNDPWDGKEKPTSSYPKQTGYALIKVIGAPPTAPPPTGDAVTVTKNIYEHLVDGATVRKEYSNFLISKGHDVGSDPDKTPLQKLKDIYGGIVSRVTDLGNQLAVSEAERKNREEQVGRLQAEALEIEKREKSALGQLNEALNEPIKLRGVIEGYAKQVGDLSTQLAEAKAKQDFQPFIKIFGLQLFTRKKVS